VEDRWCDGLDRDAGVGGLGDVGIANPQQAVGMVHAALHAFDGVKLFEEVSRNSSRRASQHRSLRNLPPNVEAGEERWSFDLRRLKGRFSIESDRLNHLRSSGAI